MTRAGYFVLCTGLGMSVGSAAFAGGPDVVTFNNVFSFDAPVDDPNNITMSRDVPGGYTLGSIAWTGNATRIAAATRGSELRVRITRPGGVFSDVQLGTGGTFAPGTIFSGFTDAFFGFDMGIDDTWQFRFFESFEDAENTADAIWNSISFTFGQYSAPSAPAVIEDFGRIGPNDGLIVRTFSPPAPATVGWYSFTIDAPVLAENFLDIDTLNSAQPNTEIALYKANGILREQDDDDGPGQLSQLTFGQGSGAPPGTGMPYNGRDGVLDAGTYYLAIAAADATFLQGFAATTLSTDLTPITFTIRTDIPSPGALALLAVGSLGVCRRRRA